MPIIQYSPWQDAANVGRGIGDSLGQMLIQLPQLQAQQRLRQQQLAIQGQVAQQRGQLYGAQTEEAKAKTGVYEQQANVSKEDERHLSNIFELGKIANDRMQFGLDPTETYNLMINEANTLKQGNPRLADNLLQQLAFNRAGIAQDPNKAMAFASPQALRSGVIPQNSVNPLLGPQGQGQISLRPGETVVTPQLGTTPSQQIQSPVPTAAQNPHLGNIAQPFAAEYAKFGNTNVLGRLSELLRTLGQTNTSAMGAPVSRGAADVPVNPGNSATGSPSVPSSIRRISSQAEYDMLPVGTPFIDDSGHTKIKGQ